MNNDIQQRPVIFGQPGDESSYSDEADSDWAWLVAALLTLIVVMCSIQIFVAYNHTAEDRAMPTSEVLVIE